MNMYKSKTINYLEVSERHNLFPNCVILCNSYSKKVIILNSSLIKEKCV